MAHGTIVTLERLGYRVPLDMGIVGFNHVVFPDPVPPRYDLTTIAAPWFDVAEKAVDVLCSLIRGQVAPLETVFPVELFAGNTV